MRYALVILYLVVLYLVLRPSPPAEVADKAVAEPPPASVVAIEPVADTAPPRTWEPPVRAIAPVAVTPVVADLQAEPKSLMRIVGVTAALEKAGEERTSVQAAPQPETSGESVERLVQKELTRLACLTGKAESTWGKRSRAALRRFARRAKPGEADEPDEALLKLLRGYPENYCKLCRPGQSACTIEATGSVPKQAEVTPSASAPAPADNHSYLPPWMQGEKLAKAVDEETPILSDAPESTPLAPEAKKVQRRRSTSSRTPQRRRKWPAISGWPAGR